MTTTTITITLDLKKALDGLKRHPRESYNEVLGRILSLGGFASDEYQNLRETVEILSDPEIMESIAQSIRDVKEGRVYSIDEV